MNNNYTDKVYYNLIEDIINNDEFKKIDNFAHHGTTRLTHSCRVSYYSYIISKKLKLNYEEAARAGLLHDFFLVENKTKKDRVDCLFAHSKYSLENASSLFNLSDREKDIIYTHMFPLNVNRVPKYMESWIVSMVDKLVAIYELSTNYKTKFVVRYQDLIIFTLIFMGGLF